MLGVCEVGFKPLKLFLSFWANQRFVLILIVGERVDRQNREALVNVDFVVPASLERVSDRIAVLLVGRVLVEPEVKHEVVELILLIWRSSVVVVLAIVVTEGHEDWRVWEVLREQLLYLLMGFL